VLNPYLEKRLFALPVQPILVEFDAREFATVMGQLMGINVPIIEQIPAFGFTAIAPVTPEIIRRVNALPGVRMVHANQVKTIFQLPRLEGEWFPTSESRQMLEAESAFREGFTGEAVKLGVTDSVPDYSPVIIKDAQGEIDILPISDLYLQTTGRVEHAQGGEDVKIPEVPIFIFTRNKVGNWDPIKHLIRHRYKGELVRVNTTGGVVDTSPNHSLIKYGSNNQHTNHRTFSAQEIKVGDKLSMPGLPKKWSGRGSCCYSDSRFIGSLDLAWLYGFFAAEGSAYHCPSKNGEGVPYENYEVSFPNSDPLLLSKVEWIFQEHFHRKLHRGNDQVVKLVRAGRDLYDHFRSLLYTSTGEKRVPKVILNSPVEVKESFMAGYFAGDGNLTEHGTWRFDSISQTLVQGILWLMATTKGVSWSVGTREDKPKVVRIQFNKSSTNGLKHKAEVQRIMSLDYEGWIYDLETENHTFCTGVGPIRCKNTGVDAMHPQLQGAEFYSTISWPAREILDENGHGSHCTSTAAGKLHRTPIDVTVEGVSRSPLLSVKCLGRGIGTGFTSEIINAMSVCYEKGCQVISMSLGSAECQGGCEVCPECRMVSTLTQRGLIVVIAAGNSGPQENTIGCPGCSPDAITVAAVDRHGEAADFSSRGGDRFPFKPDVAAPGVNIYSGTSRGSIIDLQELEAGPGFASISGTSMATPHVAGFCALLKHKFPTITTAQIKQTMAQRGHAKDFITGWGIPKWSYFA